MLVPIYRRLKKLIKQRQLLTKTASEDQAAIAKLMQFSRLFKTKSLSELVRRNRQQSISDSGSAEAFLANHLGLTDVDSPNYNVFKAEELEADKAKSNTTANRIPLNKQPSHHDLSSSTAGMSRPHSNSSGTDDDWTLHRISSEKEEVSPTTSFKIKSFSTVYFIFTNYRLFADM